MRPLALGSLLLALLGASACGSRVALFAPEATVGNVVAVRTFDAFARGDRVFVKTVITNVAGRPIIVDRDGFALRLPDGELLPRASGTTTQHVPYPLAPGQGREVFVDFHASHSLEEVSGAVLVVGGISIAGEASQRVVGEVPLSRR